MQALIVQPQIEIDPAALIREEVEKVEAIYATGSRPLSFKTKFASTQEFVEYIYERHEGMVRQWGGWRTYTAPVARKRVPAAVVREVWKEAEKWAVRQVHDKKEYPRLRRFAPFATKTWDKDDAEIPFGDLTFRFRRGQVISRVILPAISAQYGNSSRIYYTWNRFLERLGQHWAGLGSADDMPSVVLTCAPSAFLEIGHYGESTCWSNGGQMGHSKLNLAQFPGSFVGLVFKTARQRNTLLSINPLEIKEPELTAEQKKAIKQYMDVYNYNEDRAYNYVMGPRRKPWDVYRDKVQGTVSGRFWGVMGGPGAYVSNFYRIQWETYKDQILDLFSRLTGAPLTATMVTDNNQARIGAADGFRIIKHEHPLALFHGGPIEALGAKPFPRWAFIDPKGMLLAPNGEHEAVVEALRLVTKDVVAPGHKLIK
jgi:hypothetical protein